MTSLGHSGIGLLSVSGRAKANKADEPARNTFSPSFTLLFSDMVDTKGPINAAEVVYTLVFRCAVIMVVKNW